VRVGTRLILNLFEWTALPRRFSRLGLEQRMRHLERLEARRNGPSRELFVALKTLAALAYGRDEGVQRSLGVTIRCELADGGRPERDVPPLEPRAMEAPEGVERCDVVIVGSGAGGAASARVLAEAGLSVIVVEEGGYQDASSYSTDSFESVGSLCRDNGLTVCEGRPSIPMPLGRCVGGTTVMNSGTCFRTPEDVLVRWRDKLGVAWATDLDSEFEQLERDLRVEPVDPDRIGRNGELMRAGAEAIGASNGPLRRNAGHVVCCSSCPNGCRIDAKQAMHVSELPRAAAGGCLIRAGARVERVLFEGRRAVGVACHTAAGRYEVRARAVVLAAGAIGTPELLLRQGVSDFSDQIGRNLHIHPACWVGARHDTDVRGWDGVMQSWHVDEWRDRGLFMEATFTPFAFGLHWLPGAGASLMEGVESYGNVAIFGVHMSERDSRGRVTIARGPAGGGRARITYRLGARDASELRFGIARAAEMHLAAGAREVYPQIAGVAALRSADNVRSMEEGRFGPADLRLEAFHPMGTVRMGADRATSVVGPSGELHELEGLFVADASILPSSLGVNPMLTIMACARQIATGLAETLAR
jgi:choline dehydrogenase-like flavoprotein